MNTHELSANLKELDNNAQSIGQSIQRLSAEAASYRNQAMQYEQMADSLMNSAYSVEDEGQYEEIRYQSSEYMSEASRCHSMADYMESQVQTLQGELRGIRSQYEYYMNEGHNNLANLQIAVETLTGASASKYGREKIQQVLRETQQRIIYNKNLVEGCKKRIAWINQICGSAGDQYVKTYKPR